MPRKTQHLYILSAEVPPPIAAQVRSVARANRIPVSAILRQALAEWLASRG